MTLLILLWAASPLVLIPLVIRASAKNRKLERFIGQLLYEKRISVSEYAKKETERAAGAAIHAPEPLRGISAPNAPSANNAAAEQLSFIGPPLPEDMLRERRQKAAERERLEQLGAARSVTERITGSSADKPAPEADMEMIGSAESVTPEAEKAEAEIAEPVESVLSVAEISEADVVKPAESITPIEEKADMEIIESIESVTPVEEKAEAEIAGSAQSVRSAEKKKHSFNPASAMLIMGSALIIIAGMIFSTAKWSDMTELQRTGLIGLAAGFFFGVSALAHKKLKLESTGMAFYMLGSVFTSITFVTAGFFGLLGEWLSVKGSGFWLLYSLAALFVTAFSAGAVKLYKKGAFAHAALYGGLCSFTLMSLQLFGGRPDVWGLFLNVVAAVPIFLLYKHKLRFENDMYDGHMKLFTVVLTVIYAAAALPFMAGNINGGWTLPCFLTALVWTAQIIAYGILLDSALLKRLHPVLVGVILTELALSLRNSGLITSDMALLVFGISVFAAAAAYRYIPKIRTALSDVLFPLMLFCSLFAADNTAGENGVLLACMCLLTGICVIHTVSKSRSKSVRLFTNMLPLSLLVSVCGLCLLLYGRTSLDDVPLYAIAAGIAFAAAVLFTFVKPIRTLLSDIIFPSFILVCYTLYPITNCAVNRSQAALPFITSALFLVSVLIHACEDPEKHPVKHFTYILPFAAAVFGQGAASYVDMLFEESLNEHLILTFGCAVFAGAIAMRFIPRLRTRFSDYVNVIALACAAVSCHGERSGSAGYLFTAGLTAGTLILIGLQCFDGKKDRDRVFGAAMSLASIWLAWEISSAAVYIAKPEDYETRELLFSVIFMLISFAAAFAYMNIKRLGTAVSAVSFPTAVMCVSIYISGTASARGALLGMAGFLLMGVIMLAQNTEDSFICKGLRHFMWVPFVGIASALALAVSYDENNITESTYCLCAGLFIAAFGIAFRYSGHIGLNIRTLLSDIAFAALSSICAYLAFIEKPLYGVFAALAAALLSLADLTEIKPKHRNFVLASRWQFPTLLILMTAAVTGAVSEALAADYLLYPEEGELVPSLVFFLMMLTMSVFFTHIGKIRTVFSDFAIPAALFAGICFLTNGARRDLYIASIAGYTVLCAALLIISLEKDAPRHTVVHRILAPLALFAAADSLSCLLWSMELRDGFDTVIAYLIGSAVSGTAAAVFTLAAARTKEKRFTQSQYIWSLLAGIMLFPAGTKCAVSTEGIIFGVCTILLCAGMYLICGKQKRNYLGLLPVLAMLFASGSLSSQIIDTVNAGSEEPYPRDLFAAVLAAVFMLLCGLSRLTNRDRVMIHGEERTTVDFAGLAMIAAPYLTVNETLTNMGAQWCRFIAVLELGVFFLNMIRKGHERRTNLWMLTLAAASGCALIYCRPFLRPESDLLSAKLNILPLLLFSILVRMIWKEQKMLAKDLSFMAQLAAFAVLLLDALTHKSLANTIIVLCVTLTVMFVSFAARSGRWFAISSASFLGLTIYITRGFIGRVEWWAYLLIAGLLLIIVASVNEYMKGRGQTLKDAGKHFMLRWKKQ